MAHTGHTAHAGHPRALNTEYESKFTHGDLDNGVCVHIIIGIVQLFRVYLIAAVILLRVVIIKLFRV